MAAHHGSSRKTKAEQWLFGGRWRRTVKETKHPVASEAKPPAPTFPTAIQKDGDICLEKSRVHLPGLGQREIIDIAPGRKSMPEVEINMKEVREIIDIVPGRKSMPEVEINMKEVVSVLGVKVMAADMSPFMQLHAFRCAKRSHDSLDKFSSRQLAHDVKKEFDKVYGPTWHCIVGTSYGSFVTHARGCFLYFSMDKIIVMLFKTKIRKVLASS
ncbi:dynein light chain-like protein [Oryza sativa Japonica Group]|uniref:Os01g0555600 protein n=2 Tax=Oryza sativa subsp. japonica TaxID=39947 RepID=Q0JLZ2_ORYSJ|nr:uncharacterized protein LOC4324564 [Oryza sativa Japonica Group]EAZ12312.1 hypothetical protein OsJ_02203 [Oryza sativa Japonica Group]KAF2950710.1 hypothetical protein DAI22_01g207500 [Oryza sativa Japonica Group]BAB89069.1 dynein light chain-like protein [Oryza sativa Japonica Group]BAB90626.1 dynein light chain-like protein [Oryza sativa Japonica Group]BAF05236.1 Os01g0555600 [Oryza sativa Japonica Group]|eukprot:NP_001043322.1 Os01g0555600 [Oryza sativa Japonica Group]